MSSHNEKEFKPGGFLGNVKLTINDNFVIYRGAYGDRGIVLKKHIETVSTSANGKGQSDLVIAGKGVVLCRVVNLPADWAQDAMVWLVLELGL